MTSLRKLRKLHCIKCVSLLCTQSNISVSKFYDYVYMSPHIIQSVRFYRAVGPVSKEIGGNLCELAKKSSAVRQEAQGALLEYLHSTRNLKFQDAENMSKNAPEFLERLLKMVGVDGYGGDGHVDRLLSRYLRYHPVNEFEPFFESIGLKPSEYASFLPQNLTFLNDDQLLLQNYYVLCGYGIVRNRIGRIYREATEVFRSDCGVLQSRLQSFQNLGLKQSLVVKIIASSPYLLRGDAGEEFPQFLEMLRNVGIKYDWLEDHMREGDSYDWKCMSEVMCLLGRVGLTGEELGKVISHHPDILLERSGQITIFLFEFLLKFGCMKSDIRTLFLQFPDISVLLFMNNLRRCYEFLVDIELPVQGIGKMFCSCPLMLGSCRLRKVNSMRCALSCGRKKLREMVKSDPHVLKKWVCGVRVDMEMRPVKISVRILKMKFLLRLGFDEKSEEMERGLKRLRGNAAELQERFDCLVNVGLRHVDVISIIKVYPEILNQTKETLEAKIGFFVEDLGYPVSDLLAHPRILSYTSQRVKLRLLTYKWLKDEGAVNPKLSLSSLFTCSEDLFVKYYVSSHSRGCEFWEKLKNEIYSD